MVSETQTAERPKDRERLGERLLAAKVITERQLKDALVSQQASGAFLGETLVQTGAAAASAVGPHVAALVGCPYVELADQVIEVHAASMLSERDARRRQVLPFSASEDEVCVALVDPLDLAVMDELQALFDRPVAPHLAFSTELHEAINRVHDPRHDVQSAIERLPEAVGADLTDEELVGISEDAPIVRLVNSVIQGAISTGASDVHIEPQERSVRVRYRLDGLLYDQMAIPLSHLAATVSRVKIMSRLNISERRRPQDGRFSVRGHQGSEYDLRVSVMPTVYGEKVVMRVLEKSGFVSALERLGFYPDQQDTYERLIQRPHGLILVTGPTGSGKSTTLYAALHRINSPTVNINTVEDPVEYHLAGVNQVQLNPKIGVTFATGLRTLVRQDPDVIMVGEIRDAETAEIAVQAALTGHLVFSTLHTNDAPGALVRLQNMGVEPYLISSAVIGVLGQRLLRRVCPSCQGSAPASGALLETFGLDGGDPPELPVAKGCGKCGGRGMKGRFAVFEVFAMTDGVRDLVLRRASASELKSQTILEGMKTMRESGIRRMLEGQTTPEEVIRVLYAEE